jgi:hypothetical protein
MAEVLVEFDAAIPAVDGGRYAPRACARLGVDNLWEGWVEFTDVDTGAVVRTGRETTQPTRDDAMYWATGLSRVYLEGALTRALAPPRRGQPPTVSTEPAFNAPAPAAGPADQPLIPRPVIDPFEVYAQGENVLRQELRALSVDHLRAIIRAYGLDGGAGAQAHLPEVLAEYIVAEVRSSTDPARSSSASASPYRDADGDAR